MADDSDSNIFRFLKLPIEIRYLVYDYVFTSSKPIRRYPYGQGVFNPNFLRACRQIRDEGLPFIYRNKFSISSQDAYNGGYSCLLQPGSTAWENIKEISYEWWGYAIKDKRAFEALARLPKLKVLQLLITTFVLDASHHRRQWSYQTDDNVKAFRRANAFDQLVQLRGLEHVTVGRSSTNPPAPGALSKADEVKFQVFLNNVLTLPKPQPLVNGFPALSITGLFSVTDLL